jgi:hypothetical protein
LLHSWRVSFGFSARFCCSGRWIAAGSPSPTVDPRGSQRIGSCHVARLVRSAVIVNGLFQEGGPQTNAG